MLRVEIHDASNATWLLVEGRFVAAFAEETRTMVTRCKLKSKLVVDLSDMTFVDAAGEEILLGLGRKGAQFVANSSYALDVCQRLHLPMVRRRGYRGRLVREQT
ncbi:MAG TPA: hypothetical protein VE994_17690 [Terriglobales bacterium]|nr:hypothetical protein [Terriglobales bacterium]